MDRQLEEVVRRAIERGVLAQFALGVIGPVATVCLSLIYSRNGVAVGLTVLNAGVIASVVGLTFIGNIRRVRRLAATQARMRRYDGPFALLLRSFGRSELYQGLGTFVGPDPFTAPPHQVSVAATLERALRAQAIPLVALGGFNLSLDRDHELFWLTCGDRDWAGNIEVLMANAGLILVCPDITPGISTELAMLHNAGRLQKTLFVMAPAIRSGGFISGDNDRGRKAEAWAKMAAEALALDFRFPPYDPAGAILRFRSNLRIAAQPDENFRSQMLPLLVAYRREEAEALGHALLSLAPIPPADWPSFGRARERLLQSRETTSPPNYLDPPGAGAVPTHSFAMGYAMALYHHVLIAGLFGLQFFL